ncbi:AMIN-like domain-containing (lipo)protein [Gandjariella thermophila]|uniref:AMIN-like domain-containing protein n=1 Tax=Gandjariella thermophila TaxID=1931992 RepID=A0A4D4J7C7_9PSEU|nr:hypothetical protein [Gandjariella thermophila]GDY30578.1 hypothetical protein GTS_22110 [Gandjariella thermophila]
MTTRVWRLLVAPAVLLLTLASALVAGSAGAAPSRAAAACDTSPYAAQLTNIRVGRHDSYDRVVLDLCGNRPATSYRFVAQLTADPSGRPVLIPGNVFLAVTARPAAAHNDAGNPTYTGPRTFTTPSLTNVRAVALTGDFEAVLSVGLGVDHASWVHVFTLGSPTRVVIDVGH